MSKSGLLAIWLIAGIPVMAQYATIDLGVLPGGNDGAALALNDRGQVVGWSATATKPHAFLWQGGRMVDLGVLPGTDECYATGINNGGQIAGYCLSNYVPQAFLWQNGVMTALAGTGSKANAINNRGQIVGSVSFSPGMTHAAVWQNGTVVDLGTLPGDQTSDAAAVNDLGQIVGRSSGQYTSRAALWSGGTATALPDLDPARVYAYATGINNAGQISGTSSGSAVLWQGGAVQEIKAPGGRGGSAATALNDAGQVVGTTAAMVAATSQWIWPGTQLNMGQYGFPTAINQAGQIAGNAILVETRAPWASFPRISRAVLLVPTPLSSNAPAIATTSLQGAVANQPYTATLTATGGTPPYTWTMNSSPQFPFWVQPETGVVSGTPASGGTGYVTATITDSTGQSATKQIAVISSGYTPVSVAQAASISGVNAQSLNVSLPGNSVSGDAMVAVVRMATISQTVAVTDTAGNTYYEAVSQAQTTDGHQIHIFYAKNINGGPTTVTATFSGVNAFSWLWAGQFTGLSPTNPLEQTAHAQGNGTTASAGPITVGVNQLVIAATGVPSGYSGSSTAGSGFSVASYDAAGSAAVEIASGLSGTYSPTLSLGGASTDWSEAVATFLPAQATDLNITTSSLASGLVGTPYSGRLSATGGTAPYNWSGAPPPGVYLLSDGTLAGTPTQPGNFQWTASVTDQSGLRVDRMLTLSVGAVAAAGPTAVTGSLPPATVGVAYNGALAVSGGSPPYTWSFYSSTAPPGLTLLNGAITGIPTAAGTYNFGVIVWDANYRSVTQQFQLTVATGTPPPFKPIRMVQDASNSGANVQSVSVVLQRNAASGNAVIAFVRMGTTSQTVTVTDSAGNSYYEAASETQSTDGHQIHIFRASKITGSPNTVTATFSGVNPSAWIWAGEFAGLAGNVGQTARAQGSSGNVRAGPITVGYELLIAGTGFAAGYGGKPFARAGFDIRPGTAAAVQVAAGLSGAYSPGFALVGGSTEWSEVAATFSAEQDAGLEITTPGIGTALMGTPYSARLSARGGTPPYTWSGAAAPGLALSADGILSGTPTLVGTSEWIATVTDSAGVSVRKLLSATVSTGGPTSINIALPAATEGVEFRGSLNAIGGMAPYSWSYAGALPPGLSLSAAGVLSGMPSTAGTYIFSVTATDANGASTSQVVQVTVQAATGQAALVQSRSVEATRVTAIQATFASANRAGNLIVAFVRMSTSSQTVSVGDTAGNIYAEAVGQTQDADGHQIHVFYAKSILGGLNSVRASFPSTNEHPWIAVYEFSGVGGLVSVAQAQGNGPLASTPQVAVSAGDLVFAGFGLASDYVSGAGAAVPPFLTLERDDGTSRAVNAAITGASAGPYSGTLSLSPATAWSAVVATFR